MRFDSGIDIARSAATSWQEANSSYSSGFKSEHAVVVGILGVILLLMIARKRGWGSNSE